MSNLENLRKQIRQIISEIAVISESQKRPEVDNFIDDFFRKAIFYIDGYPLPSEIAKRELASECPIQLKRMVNQVQSGNLEYENFYVIKLGRFVATTAKGDLKISFEEPGSSDSGLFKDISTSFLLYGYHDTLFKVVPYNENYYVEAKIQADVERYLQSPDFQQDFSTKTQRAKFVGEIKFLEFDRRIKVYTEYFNQKSLAPQQPAEKAPFAKSKKSYRPNTPLLHKIFGKGVIKASKKVREEPDGVVYNLEVDFPNYGVKTIQMKSAA